MAKFILHFSGGSYSFTFHVSSGDRVATSPPHLTKSSAQQAINEVRTAGTRAHLYKKCNSNNQYYFELYNDKEKLLVTSERYWSEESRDYGIVVLKKYGSDAGFVDVI